MKNIQNIALVGLCLVVFLVIGFNSNAFAQCSSYEYCYAANDSGSNPLCTTGSYDPCDNYVYWWMEFHRTSKTFSSSHLILNLVGASLIENFSSEDYAPNTDNKCNSGQWIYVGPSSDHELRLTRTGSPGYFTRIKPSVRYAAGGGS
ncbi:MAG: hypothetical protein J7K40_10840 [candidate division Zixibacteria bacterium]|nr:hypothetical protein [candidate division Zixibacteria bacterium]